MAYCLKNSNSIFVNNNKLFILDAITYSFVANVSGTFSRPYSVTIDAPNNRFFVTNGIANTVAIYNLTTLAFVANVSGTFSRPRYVTIDAPNNRFFVTNGIANTVAIYKFNYR